MGRFACDRASEAACIEGRLMGKKTMFTEGGLRLRGGGDNGIDKFCSNRVTI